MKYPTLKAPSGSREMLDTFKGYNHNLRIADGEFYDMENMTSAHYWYHWLLMVKTTGEVSFSRYSDGTEFTEAPTTAWLPFQLTFIADQ